MSYSWFLLFVFVYGTLLFLEQSWKPFLLDFSVGWCRWYQPLWLYWVEFSFSCSYILDLLIWMISRHLGRQKIWKVGWESPPKMTSQFQHTDHGLVTHNFSCYPFRNWPPHRCWFFVDKVVVTSVCASIISEKRGPPSGWWSCKSVSKAPSKIFFDLKVQDRKKHEKKKPSEHVFNLENFPVFRIQNANLTKMCCD